jgi:hypothetical protein
MAAGLMVVALPPAHAVTTTFVTPAGATVPDGAVNASATFTTSANTLTVTLTDLLANPTSVGQLVSDLIFRLSSGQTTGTLSSSSGQLVSISSTGAATVGATTTTGWGLNNNVSGGLQLDALGFVGPAGLIVGPSGPGGVYTNANGSIAGNGPHNPFINGTATFSLMIAGLLATDSVTSALFSLGTTAGVEITGVPSAIPLPGALPLFATGMVGLGLLGWRKKRKAQAAAA